jgi:oligoribonuclease NrnB/cAMP/cGMP phosphodiesterase (DHH superfamily)
VKQKSIVIVHANCPDGHTAAWLYKKFKGDADFVYANYGDKPPDVKGREVWMIDFSFPREVMIKDIIVPSLRTTVLDHHQTAQAALDKIHHDIRNMGIQRTGDVIQFDMTRSGAGMAFDYFEDELNKAKGFKAFRPHGDRKVKLVDYIEDRDLWKLKQPDTKAVSAWIFTQPYTFEAWDELEKTPIEEMARKGEAILKYIDLYGDKACAMARMEHVGGYAVPTINIAYMNCSDHVNKLLDKYPEAKFAVGYFRRGDGQWQFSLRSRADFDCSEVAKTYGGGGHKQAAGFQVDVLPWMEIQELQPEELAKGTSSAEPDTTN